MVKNPPSPAGDVGSILVWRSKILYAGSEAKKKKKKTTKKQKQKTHVKPGASPTPKFSLLFVLIFFPVL